MKKNNFSDLFGFLIAAAIIGLLVWSLYFSKNNNRTEQTTTQVVNQPPVQSYRPTNNLPAVQPAQSIDTTSQRESANNYQLCQVHLVNTLNGTDKTGGYKAVMNIEKKILTLTYVGNATEIIQITSDTGGLNTLRFYNNGSLEAEKTVYRRTDLESGNKEIIYTTRTEQVKLVISY